MIHNPLEGSPPELNINLHQNTEEKISIIIVHNDRPTYLNLTLQSIEVCSVHNNFEVIVVDNGSIHPDSIKFLKEIEGDVKVIRNNKNLFWSEAANIGANAVSKDSKYLLFLHHDVVIENPAWLDILVNMAQTQESGLIGVEMANYMIQNQKMDFVQEWLCFMTKEAFKDVGGWPSKLPQIGMAFIMTAKCQFRGWKPEVINNKLAYHYKTMALDISEYERFIEAAQKNIPELLKEAQNIKKR